jgi:threonine dehydrogenase-like Zn-dependent dehydrogenase
MRAIAIFPATKQIQVIDNVPESNITSPTEVKVKVLEVGVCGTDKDICAFNYGQPPKGLDYLIPGHEILAEVIAIGSKVSRLKVGDLTYIMVRRPCGDPSCIPCLLNHQDFCSTGNYTERGIKEHHGYLTEFIVDDEKFMAPVPKHLKSVGVLVDPITIIMKALQEMTNIQHRLPHQSRHKNDANPQGAKKHRALVIGAGAVGLTGAMAIVKRDYETFVYSAGTTSEKQNIVKAIGATYIAAETCTAEQLMQQLGSVDVVYEAAGAAQVAFDVIPILNINGIFIFTGIPGRKESLDIDLDLIMRDLVLKNQIIFGSVNASIQNCEAAVADLNDFMKLWPNIVPQLITGRFPMEEYADLASNRSTGIKNVIQITK